MLPDTILLSFDNLCAVYAELVEVRVCDGRESWTVRLGNIFPPDMKPIPGWEPRTRMLAPGTELVLEFYAPYRALESLIRSGHANQNFYADIVQATESRNSVEECEYFRSRQAGKNAVELAGYMSFLGPFPTQAADQLRPFLSVYQSTDN